MTKRKDIPGQLTMEGCSQEDIANSTIPTTTSARLTPKQGEALDHLREYGSATGLSAHQMGLEGFGKVVMYRLWDLGAVSRRISVADGRGVVWMPT